MRILARLSLTTKFYLVAGVMLAVAAFGFSVVASDYVFNKNADGATKHAGAHASELQAEYRTGLTPDKWERLARKWRLHHILDLKLLRPDGTVENASDPGIIGKRIPLSSQFRQALSGKPASDFSAVLRPGGRADKDLITFWAPILANHRVKAVHELSFSAAPMRDDVRSVSRYIWLGDFAVFGLLFLLLSGIVRQASRRITAQQQSLEGALRDLDSHFVATIQSFNVALQSRDHYTGRHSDRVAFIAVAIGAALGLGCRELEALRVGGLFHDVGKIGIPDHILLKPGVLTSDEMSQIRLHPAMGCDILGPLPSMGKSLGIIRHHHERWDGGGYPDGLKGEDIEIAARVAAYADVYDALTTARPYRPAMTHGQALKIIRSEIGTHFDPGLAPVALGVLSSLQPSNLAASADSGGIAGPAARVSQG